MSTVAGLKMHSFYSRGRQERLVRQPQIDVETALGRKIRQQEAVRYDFAPDGRIEVYEGQDMLPDGPLDPETREPTMQDAVAWLTSHPQLNIRFWHEGNEPGRLLPTEDDFFAICSEAVADLHLEPVQVALANELETHKRPLLVKAAEGCIAQINRKIAEHEAAAEEK